MKCPVCVESGLVSNVYPDGWSATTDMAWNVYYDEAGVKHAHDPNWHGQGYACSNKHRWHEGWLAKCKGCDYGGEVNRHVF